MSFEVVIGDLFKLPVSTKVCTVNTVGAMGAGVARVYRARFWDAYVRYRAYCFARKFSVNSFLIQRNGAETWVLFPTKKDWKEPSKIEWIQQNLERLAKYCTEYSVKEIAMPALGCRNGGLSLEDVQPLIEATFKDHPTRCIVVLW